MGRKWANIVAKKTAKDGATSKIYAKFGVEIYAAAKQGWTYCGKRQPGHPFADYRRRLCRRGQRPQLPAHHRDIVFLPVVSGRQWLYGEGGLCHGQNAPQNRPFGEKLCADDHRIRLLSACHHGHEDAAFGAGPEGKFLSVGAVRVPNKRPHPAFSIPARFPGA